MTDLPSGRLAEVLRHLENLGPVRRLGKNWSARCPVHDDKRPSLSVALGKDGRVLLHCHAGCKFEDILDALGLEPRDLFEQPPAATSQRSSDQRPKILRTYPYVDESGALLFEVVRFQPKGFRQRRPDPDKPSEWIWDLHGVRRVLFRLPRVLKAAMHGKLVFVVEGEKDVLRLEKAGFVATTNPGGAGKWRDAYSESLAGVQVVVLPDNDEAGRSHERLVARSVAPHAASVKVVELPGLPPKGDLSDWFAAGGDGEALRELIRTAPPFEPGTDGQEAAQPSLADGPNGLKLKPPDSTSLAETVRRGKIQPRPPRPCRPPPLGTGTPAPSCRCPRGPDGRAARHPPNRGGLLPWPVRRRRASAPLADRAALLAARRQCHDAIQPFLLPPRLGGRVGMRRRARILAP